MTLKTTLLAAASALVLSAGAAAAAPATAQSPLNLRAGPGTQYEVVGTIPGGATVDVAGCTGSWCQVNFNGESGFASRSFLQMAEGGPVVVAPGYAYDDTPYYGGDDYYDYGYDYGPGVGVFVGPRHHGFHHGFNGHWNDGRVGTWNGGHHRNGNQPGSVQPMNRGASIGGRPATSAPVGMPTGGGRGGAFHGGGAPAGGAHVGGGGAIGGGGHAGGPVGRR